MLGNKNILSTKWHSNFISCSSQSKCKFIVSDSGGLQEEAISFRECVLILRELTERPEVVGYGWGSLIGTDSDKVLKAKHFADGVSNKNDASSCNPFGNGYALETIFDVMMNYQKTWISAQDKRLCNVGCRCSIGSNCSYVESLMTSGEDEIHWTRAGRYQQNF